MDSFGPGTWQPTTYRGHVAYDNAAHSNRTIQPCPMWHHFALVTWCGVPLSQKQETLENPFFLASTSYDNMTNVANPQ